MPLTPLSSASARSSGKYHVGQELECISFARSPYPTVNLNHDTMYETPASALQVTKKHHFLATALTFGKNKYNVVVNPNVDQAFVAAIVTIMDAIYEDNNEM
ncbi:hypothetical protein AXG93_2752s1280 [Marchantia polymorpha subsp. ruderalis]|uniref:Uncharacterized protein n=1 Tax=Marchantia polymorpha subsp. ruderalis TaxID=1480154 RepID=A0A176VTH5_MARPO|nr:hypothetical protein AXG93_2752s1280 [Marchantia polymorpha subsp. ruderalis]